MPIHVKVEEFIDDIEEWYAEVDEKVEETLDKVYEKVPGNYFGLVGLILYSFSTFAAVFLYVSVDPSYSVFTHWISHLGDGPNGANHVFNMGWTLSSFILFFFYVYQIRIFRNKGVKEKYLDLMSLASLCFAVGVLLVGMFPLHLGTLHTIAANFYFIGGFGFIMLYGSIVLSLSDIPNMLSLAAFTTAACYMLYFLSPTITVYTSKIGVTMNFLEWLTLISNLAMMLVVVKHSFKTKNQILNP